jgi:hypothetical protein
MTNEEDILDEPLEMIKICGPTEAQMIEELLKNNNIDCTLQGDVSSTPWPTTGEMDEVRIWVKKEDAFRARELLDAYFTPVGKDELEEGERDLGVDDPDEPGGFTV